MYLILLRHAEKAISFENDPGLTPAGQQQALQLPEKLIGQAWPRPMKLQTSPKRRTHETLAPLAKSLDQKIVEVADLDERGPQETRDAFRNRLRELLLNFEENPVACAIWCTHMDCLEEISLLLNREVDLAQDPFAFWAPAQYVVLKIQDLWEVVEFGRPL